MAEFPALPLWTDAYLADTRHLSTLEHGAYLLLLMEAWRRPHCDLPDDDRILSRLAGLTMSEWEEVKPIVMALWTFDGRSKTWKQNRLSIERSYVKKKSRSQRDKAARRWNKRKNTDAAALPDECRDDAPTPTPTPNRTTLEADASNSVIPFPNGNGCQSPPEFELEPVDDQPKSGDHLTVDEIVEAWNKLASECGLPQVVKLTGERRRKAVARIREFTFDEWAQALAAIRRSRFLRGENGRGWRANFDFLLQPSSFTKLLEGYYDDTSAAR